MSMEHGTVQGVAGAGARAAILVTAAGAQIQRVGGVASPANVTGLTVPLVTGRVLKGSAGTVVQIKITNTGAGAQWYGIYDCTSVNSADGNNANGNLLDVIQVGAATTVVYPWPLAFVTGCTVVNNGATEPHAANAPGAANSDIKGIVD